MKKEIKTEIKYITSDGWKWSDKKLAEEHENKIENSNKIITLKSGKEISHNDIVEYFSSVKCDNCPFALECEEMYNRIRRSTTNTFELCSVIKKTLSEEDLEDW